MPFTGTELDRTVRPCQLDHVRYVLSTGFERLSTQDGGNDSVSNGTKMCVSYVYVQGSMK